MSGQNDRSPQVSAQGCELRSLGEKGARGREEIRREKSALDLALKAIEEAHI